MERRIRKPTRRILKSSGLESLRRKLVGSPLSRSRIISKVKGFFSNPTLEWSAAVTRDEMNKLWCSWVKNYNHMVEKLIGTRPARDAKKIFIRSSKNLY